MGVRPTPSRGPAIPLGIVRKHVSHHDVCVKDLVLPELEYVLGEVVSKPGAIYLHGYTATPTTPFSSLYSRLRLAAPA
ncbi:hypothetical protein NQZ68_010904 [Dissostichus eleginoides]|nr:hypothetical protein NQZ68_010904 [Dissostichus eleginoides]